MNALHAGRDTVQRTLLVLPCMYTFWMEFPNVIILKGSLPADVLWGSFLWGSFVTHSFLPSVGEK